VFHFIPPRLNLLTIVRIFTLTLRALALGFRFAARLFFPHLPDPFGHLCAPRIYETSFSKFWISSPPSVGLSANKARRFRPPDFTSGTVRGFPGIGQLCSYFRQLNSEVLPVFFHRVQLSGSAGPRPSAMAVAIAFPTKAGRIAVAMNRMTKNTRCPKPSTG